MPSRTPLERLQRKLTIETLWIYVLSVLKKNGPTYGYKVKKLIKETYGINPSTVTLYTVLYRLERGGYVQKTGNDYQITEKGLEELEKGIQLIESVLNKIKETIREGGSNGP